MCVTCLIYCMCVRGCYHREAYIHARTQAVKIFDDDNDGDKDEGKEDNAPRKNKTTATTTTTKTTTTKAKTTTKTTTTTKTRRRRRGPRDRASARQKQAAGHCVINSIETSRGDSSSRRGPRPMATRGPGTLAWPCLFSFPFLSPSFSSPYHLYIFLALIL